MKWLKRLFGRKAKFNIGDTIKCIDDRGHIVVFGREYVVKDRIRTECCGDWCYDVGLESNGYTECNDCDVLIPGNGIRWAAEKRFASHKKVEERTKLEQSVSIETKEILEKEIEHVGVN